MNSISVVTDFPRKIKEIENIWIPMADGTRLAARMWLPKDAEDDPVPAILEYLPYRKRDGTAERDQLTHPYFAGHGYASVRVDMRGSGDSEGVCLGEYLQQEQDDALDVIDWLAQQSWCSGKVGMIGISWGGFNGLQIAARQPAALAAVISLCSTDDRYADDIHFMGGCMLTDKLAWGGTAFAIAHTPPDPAIVGERWRDMWLERLNSNGLWMLDWFRHQRRDDFYQHGSICENYGAIKIPVYAVGGWADGYTNTVFRLLEHLPENCKGLIGPWAHKYPHIATPEPRIGFLQECLRWWDQHLKNIDTGIMQEQPLRAWIQDPIAPAANHSHRPGRWVAEANWCQDDRATLSYYPNAGTLTDKAADAPITVASPQNAGWTASAWCGYGGGDGAIDQNGEWGLMNCFDSEPLTQDITLLGMPFFYAKISCSAAQGNIAVVLSAVDEHNQATLLSYGVLNLTHYQSHSQPKPLTPGEFIPISVQLNALGQRVAAGQRLRLALSTAYWPVIWPAQHNVTLTLAAGSARLTLPIRADQDADNALAPFAEPTSAPPLQQEEISPPSFQRTRKIDYSNGIETIERISDKGRRRHLHTGITMQSKCLERFQIDPQDANSATAISHWHMSFKRDAWQCEIETFVEVSALEKDWQIKATLCARDKNGVVAEKEWSEVIPRDLV